MNPGMKRRHALGATVAFCAVLAGSLAGAETFQLADMTGLWAVKQPMGSSTVYHVYQVVAGPASLTLQWARNDTVNPLPGQGQTQSLARRYELSVSDRALSGTVTIGPGVLAGCNFGAGTYAIQSGRISPDGTTITIVENHPEPSIYPCEWAAATGDNVAQFERYH